MSEAQTILKMIEAVDPNDTDTLDEIDRLFANYRIQGGIEVGSVNMSRVTRSRDALKSVRPKGCGISIVRYLAGWCESSIATEGCCGVFFGKETTNSPPLPTEELAELHAIIQTIEWERNNETI